MTHNYPVHHRRAWRIMLTSFITIVAAGMVGGCSPSAYKITPISPSQKLQETQLRRDALLTQGKIAIIDLDGVIMNYSSQGLLSSTENPVSVFTEKIRQAQHDAAVKALVLRINSPGGGVTASDIIYDRVMRYRQATDKPVVAMCMDVTASGGYYIACAADAIMAHPTTVTGSIGVIMQTVSFSGLLDKIGVHTDAITSGKYKDAGSPWRDMKQDERQIFQQMIDEYYKRFVDVVAKSRTSLEPQRIRDLADGRIYTGQQALDAGLIDHLGTLDDAIARAKELAGISRASVVMYHRPYGYKGTVYSQTSDATSVSPVQVTNIFNIDLPHWAYDASPRFLYLWRPGNNR